MKIAISGLSGVGSSTTAKLVAKEMNLQMTNFTFRALAEERGVAFEELQTQAATDASIDLELDRRLIAFVNAHDNCLAATDLACWLDHPNLYARLGLEDGAHYDYKIWLEAPIEVRAKRMHEREGGDLASVTEYNHQRDLDNRERYLGLYGVDIFDHRNMDWVLETSDIDLDMVVATIVAKLRTLT
jgi:cytidylate kinase